MAQKKIDQKYQSKIISSFIIPICMFFRRWKESQRANLFDRQQIVTKWSTLLDIGTGDGLFSSYLKKTYGYSIIGYDIQRLLHTTATLDDYQVWWAAVLENILHTNTIDTVIIAYTLHHMNNETIIALFLLLKKYSIRIIVLEEYYLQNKILLCMNDIVSNSIQYGLKKININEYYQLNFKREQERTQLFKQHGYTSTVLWKKQRYGYIPSIAYALT